MKYAYYWIIASFLLTIPGEADAQSILHRVEIMSHFAFPANQLNKDYK